MDYEVMAEFREWHGAHVRAGQRFAPKAEAALDGTLRSLAQQLYPAAGEESKDAIAEFVGPNGVADFVILTRAEENLANRIASGLPYLSTISEAALVAAVPVNRTRTLRWLAKELGITERHLAGLVRRLARAGILIPTGGGYRRNPAMVPVGRMYALEAKVSDWRRAMSQAMRYATWSDAVGVVLLSLPKDPAVAIARARSLQIGLAVGNAWLVRPKLRRGKAALRLWSSERFVRAVSEGRRSDLAS